MVVTVVVIVGNCQSNCDSNVVAICGGSCRSNCHSIVVVICGGNCRSNAVIISSKMSQLQMRCAVQRKNSM